MKKIILLSLMVLVLFSSVVFALDLKSDKASGNNSAVNQTNKTNNPGSQNKAQNTNQTNKTNSVGDNNQVGQQNNQGQQNQTGENTQNQTENNGSSIGEQMRKKAENKQELKQMIKDKNEELKEKLKELKEQKKEREEYHNQVKVAVHTLLASENLTGGIGQNVSEIAKEFNNSVQVTIRAQERIQNKNKLVRYLFGGNEQAADEIQQEVEQNQQRIQELEELLDKCDCDQEIKTILQEQIQLMEQEQIKLNEMAKNEKSYKGIFGWIWKK